MSSNIGLLNRDLIGGTLCVRGQSILKGGLKVKGLLDLTKADIFGAGQPLHITQRLLNNNAGVYTINKPGPYIVDEDLTGTLTVEVDGVYLDLNCSTLDANGAAIAITADGYNNVIIMNGSIIGATTTAISVSNTDCIGVYNINFDGATTSEQAMLIDTCTNVEIYGCKIKNFLSTSSAIIQMSGCDGLIACGITITNCTKTLAAPSGGFPDALFNVNISIISILNCNNFDFTGIHVNNNTSNSTQTTNGFSAIQCVTSSFGTFRNCTCNNNTTINGGFPGVVLFYSFLCKSLSFYECECNNNFADGPVNFYLCLYGFTTTNGIMENCRVNYNRCTKFHVEPGILASLGLIALPFSGSGNIIRKCSANYNVVDDTDIRPLPIQNASIVGINIDSYGILEDCESIYNSIGTSYPYTYVNGILFDGGFGQTATRCVVANITGGEVCIALEVNTSQFGFPSNVTNINVSDCKFVDIDGYGIHIGKYFLPNIGTSNNIIINNCVFDNVGKSSGDLSVIRAPLLNPPIKNLEINNCIFNKTFATSGNAFGIDITDTTNLNIKNTTINETTASGTGTAITLNNITNAKIINCNITETKNSGIKFQGNCTSVFIENCNATSNDIGFDFDVSANISKSKIKDCEAINNTTAGYNYAPAVSGVAFIGNEAVDNGNNYVIASGNINLQQLSLSTGTYTSVNGSGAVLGSPLTNLEIVA